MHTGNKTEPVHIDPFICTLINFVDKDVMLVVVVVVVFIFSRLKKRRRKRVRVAITLDLQFWDAELKSRSNR